ncbi:MAG: hypothetical protein Q7U56_05475 [Humidesulfovibrio sp.]|nr:hypothetical protein [Humidesulfovibrio sp.]
MNDDDDSLPIAILKRTINKIIEKLHKGIQNFSDTIEYTHYADTFLIYSKTEDSSGYPALVRAAKNLITSCIDNRLPARGAIAYGEVSFGHGDRIIIGKAALESYTYCEDQDWIGLLLTPTASQQLKSIGLEPVRHGFINKDIPLRKLCREGVYAYKFINGSTSYRCPQLQALHEMRNRAPEDVKHKYQNTIHFIERYYTMYNIEPQS